jgi:hypothetical protein
MITENTSQMSPSQMWHSHVCYHHLYMHRYAPVSNDSAPMVTFIRGLPRINETAQTESAYTGARLYYTFILKLRGFKPRIRDLATHFRFLSLLVSKSRCTDWNCATKPYFYILYIHHLIITMLDALSTELPTVPLNKIVNQINCST